MLTELFVRNLASTIVVHGGTDVPTPGTIQTLTVKEANGIFPVVRRGEAQFHFKDRDPECGDEIFRCIETEGAHWTVIRGAENSLTVPHSRGFTIRQVTTSEFFQRLGAGSTTDQCNVVTVCGADPSGTEPADEAIMQALSYGPAYLPSGTYSIRHPLNLNPGSVLLSFGNAVIKPTRDFAGDAAIELVDGSGITRLEHLTLDGSNLAAGTSIYGIFSETRQLEAELRSIRISSFPNSGIIASGNGWFLERISCIRNFGSGFEISLSNSPLIGCRAIGNSRYGFIGANPDQLGGCISTDNRLGDRA